MNEFKVFMKHVKTRKDCEKWSSKEHAEKLFLEIDKDHSKEVSLDEFIKYMG